MNLGRTIRQWCAGAGRLLPALGVALLLVVPSVLPVAHAAERPGAASRERDRADPPQRPRPPREQEPPVQGIREPVRSRRTVSIDQAISQVERRYKARVVRAEQAEMGGRPIYVLRLLSDEGRVSVVRVDAETGGVM